MVNQRDFPCQISLDFQSQLFGFEVLLLDLALAVTKSNAEPRLRGKARQQAAAQKSITWEADGNRRKILSQLSHTLPKDMFIELGFLKNTCGTREYWVPGAHWSWASGVVDHWAAWGSTAACHNMASCCQSTELISKLAMKNIEKYPADPCSCYAVARLLQNMNLMRKEAVLGALDAEKEYEGLVLPGLQKFLWFCMYFYS